MVPALPPGPEGRHLFGNTLDFKRDPLGFLTRCSREYGDVISLSFMGRPFCLLNHPDHIAHVLVRNNRNFKKRNPRYLQRLRQQKMLVGNSLLSSEGEFWHRQRQLVQPAFHRQRINAYGEVMHSCTERMLATWQDGETREIHQEMMRLSLGIVARTLFFDTEAGRIEKVKKALGQVAETFGGGGGGGIRVQEGAYGLLRQFVGYLRFRRALRRLDQITYEIIGERRILGNDTGDLLSMLMSFQDQEGNRISDKQLRDEMVALFFAGHETTAIALSWTFYLLSQHPEVETKLLAELQQVLGDRTPTVEDVPPLRYTEMVLRESMRLFPPVWRIGRKVEEDCEIGGYWVPAGTRLIVSQWVTHRDPRFFEEPALFNPDRWEEGFVERLPRYAYLPFGGGPRRCIGSSFAMMQSALVLATVAKRFRLELTSGQRVIPQPSITLRPKGGVEMILKKR